MSIIYDALKKVETSQTNDSKTKIDKGFKSKLKIYLLYASMICLGLFIANIFYGRLLPKPSLNTTDIVTKGRPLIDKKETVSSSQPSTEPAALQTSAYKESPPSFTLNGVFFSGAEGYALINNRIVKKGDKVGEYEVFEISKDRVLLKKGNQSFYLVFSEE